MAKTERESDRRKREAAALLVLPRPAKSLQNRAGFSKKLEHNGSAEKKWPQCHKEATWYVRQSRLCQKKRYRTVCPEHQIVRWERIKVSERRTLAREMGIRAVAWGKKDGPHSEGRQVPRRTRRASKKKPSYVK